MWLDDNCPWPNETIPPYNRTFQYGIILNQTTSPQHTSITNTCRSWDFTPKFFVYVPLWMYVRAILKELCIGDKGVNPASDNVPTYCVVRT